MSALPPNSDRKSGPPQSHVCFSSESGHVQCNGSCLADIQVDVRLPNRRLDPLIHINAPVVWACS
jgi:hypothetical protein